MRFLGVSLGLFDYIADKFKFENTPLGRFKTALIAFIHMVFFHSYSRFVLCTLLVMSLSALADTDPVEATDPGLDIVEKSWHGEIRFSADVDWASYSKIQLERATVEFRKRWARDLRQRPFRN